MTSLDMARGTAATDSSFALRSARTAQAADIAARLERLPLTSYQRGIFGIIATAWFFDSMDLAALTWNGYKSCYYRTYMVGRETNQEQKDYYAIALKWLYDSIKAVKVGATTRDIASKWPSAKEAWGYEEEDQAAANLWGHGLGLAQYDQPVISRIWSLDHPIEIKEGMVFALETQHGKPYQWGVRIEEMLIVHKDSVEIVSNFPVEQITVVDPMPGYSDYGKRPGT